LFFEKIKIKIMNENLNQKPKVAAPPNPEVAIRTMDSDVKTLEASGGEGILPETISLPESKAEPKFEIPGYAGPEKPLFSPTAPVSEEMTAKPELETGKSKWKLTGIIVGILAIIAIFGLLGYFVISPWLFPKEMPAAQ
jgi:hypothetical protein